MPVLEWKIDLAAAFFERIHFRGWCYHREKRILSAAIVFGGSSRLFPLTSFGIPSDDVAAAFGPAIAVSGPPASNARFDEWIVAPPEFYGRNFSLSVLLSDGSTVTGPDGLTNAATSDPFFQGWENFLLMLDRFETGTVLEIGSRARSGVVRGHRIPSRLKYVGLDLLAGPNVDLVGDAHALAECCGANRFVAVFSTSVFEHLAMPWKVVLELNKVLELDGIVYTASHQTWPLHEVPADFWRFSQYSWPALFNSATGFRILETAMGEPAFIHAARTSGVTRSLPESPAWLGSSCLAEKTGETSLSWPVATDLVGGRSYRPGELSEPPSGVKT